MIMTSGGHMARMEQMKNAYKILVRKPKGKIPFGRPRCDWKFFSPPQCPNRLWGPHSLLSNWYRMQSGRGVKLTTHLHLAPRLRMRGAIPPLPNTSSWR